MARRLLRPAGYSARREAAARLQRRVGAVVRGSPRWRNHDGGVSAPRRRLRGGSARWTTVEAWTARNPSGVGDRADRVCGAPLVSSRLALWISLALVRSDFLGNSWVELGCVTT